MFLGGFAANTFIPIPEGDDEMGFPTVTVVGDWASASAAWDDVSAALGIDALVAGEESFGISLDIHMYIGDGIWNTLRFLADPSGPLVMWAFEWETFGVAAPAPDAVVNITAIVAASLVSPVGGEGGGIL